MSGQRLTDELIAELSRNVAMGKMESLALGFLGANVDHVEALKDQHQGKSEPFNRDILRDWRNSNPVDNQVQKLAVQLHKAAAKGSYINPNKVTDILGVSKQQAEQLEEAFKVLKTTGSASGSANASTTGTGRSHLSSQEVGADSSAASNTDTDQALTDAMVNNLAQCLTSEERLRKLAMNGFGMKRYVVERHVENYRRINDAAYHLLSEWLNSKATRVVAYRDLCAALTAAGLKELIQELQSSFSS